jgi:hypothetical protein
MRIWTGVPEAEVTEWIEGWVGLCEEINELVDLDVKGEMNV